MGTLTFSFLCYLKLLATSTLRFIYVRGIYWFQYIGFDYTAYMDCMDLNGHCPRKDVKLNHSFTHSSQYQPSTCWIRPGDIHIYISSFYNFSALGWSRKCNSFLVREKDPFIMHSQYHGCSCPGDERSQGKSSHDVQVDNHGVELIRLVYSGFNTKIVNTLIVIHWLLSSMTIITSTFYSARIKNVAYNVITMSFLVVIHNIMISTSFPWFKMTVLTSRWIFVGFEMTC